MWTWIQQCTRTRPYLYSEIRKLSQVRFNLVFAYKTVPDEVNRLLNSQENCMFSYQLPRFLTFGAVILMAGAAAAVQVTVPLLSKAPVIDGTITAAEQKSAAKVTLGLAGDFGKPHYQTNAWIAATLDGIYVGFVANEPDLAHMVTSTTQVNGPVFQDDSVQIFLAPARDTASDNYYQFAVNSAGVRFSDFAGSNASVKTWKSAVAKGTGEWSAEFFIPLESIDAPQDLPFWRANLARVRPARGSEKTETSAWVYTGSSLYNYTRFGFLTMPSFVPKAPTGTVASISTRTLNSDALFTPVPVAPITKSTTTVTTTTAPSLSTTVP
jgi:hypothetical protein